MTRLDNTCEGTNGADIGTATIGGPSPFTTAAVAGVGAAKVFDNTHTHKGLTAIKLTLPTVSAMSYFGWTGQTATASVYTRCYYYITAAPTVSVNLIRIYNAGTFIGFVRINTGRTLTVINSASATVGSTSTGTIALNTLTRIEFEITGMSGTTGTFAARVYSGANLETNTPDFSIAPTSSTTGAATGTEARFGTVSSTTMTAAWDSWFDDCAYSDVSQPGPAITQGPAVPIRPALIRASSW